MSLGNLKKDPGDLFFVEPSAGRGDFYKCLPPGRRIGFDLAPKYGKILQGDFLQLREVPAPRSKTMVIGNPPFGRRGKKAVEFFCKGAEIADTIAFVVPAVFRKYSVHKQLARDLQLIWSARLPENSFYTTGGNGYRVNTEFQVWTRLPIQGRCEDKRLLAPPPVTHEDFCLYQYNNTREAEKVFKNNFDFAVPCQGWQDYTRREENPDRCERSKQWMLIKANCKSARHRLFHLDYERLAQNGTIVPGFRKHDVVGEYIESHPRL